MVFENNLRVLSQSVLVGITLGASYLRCDITMIALGFIVDDDDDDPGDDGDDPDDYDDDPADDDDDPDDDDVVTQS